MHKSHHSARVFKSRMRKSIWTFSGFVINSRAMAGPSSNSFPFRSRPRALIFMCVFSRANLSFFTHTSLSNDDQIFVFFADEKSVGVKTMRKWVVSKTSSSDFNSYSTRFLGILEEKKIQRGIIVFPGNMTPSARKVCYHQYTYFFYRKFLISQGDYCDGFGVPVRRVFRSGSSSQYRASYTGTPSRSVDPRGEESVVGEIVRDCFVP